MTSNTGSSHTPDGAVTTEWATLRLQRHPDGVRVLTLANERKRNAISLQMRDDLAACVADVKTDPDARALVVTGAGIAFCAGADLPEVFGGPQRSVAQTRDHLKRIYDSFLAVKDLAIPTLAAVNGHAVGAGVNLALACDMRLAGPDATFGVTFTRIGLPPGGGCTYFLVRELGTQQAMRLLLKGETLDAEQALSYGLTLGTYDDPLAEALEFAHGIAALDPHLVRDIKAGVALAQEGLEPVLAHEAWAQAATAADPEVRDKLTRPRR
ncbi:enoyl-CoA hydratase-related protein [Salinactinospora qingdaonensis]|uniref:Enoyl-CoA hydratase n=1 Tax=Salinactinospora qingdaonensis TaxID=702744 RepID=A0ABP7F4Y3_9ACTN